MLKSLQVQRQRRPKRWVRTPYTPKSLCPPTSVCPPRRTPSIRPWGGGPGGVQLRSQLMLKSLQVQCQRRPKRWVDPDPIYSPPPPPDPPMTLKVAGSNLTHYRPTDSSRDGQMVVTSPQVGTGKICMAIARPIASPQAIFWHGN